MKKFFIITAILMATISAAAQTDRAHTLKVYNWADYMDMDLIPEFEEYYEQETGEPVKIVYQTYDINENMLTEIEVGHEDYDVVCPSEYIIERMLRKGLLQKIDTNFVETTENNFNNVSPWIREKLELISPSDTIRVGDYAVGYFWGTTGFLYNKAYVDEDDVKSWGAIHNPKFQGQIFIKDAFRDVYSVMIQYAKYQDIEAGRADRQHLACDLSDENLKAVEDVLLAAKPQVAGWEADFGKDRVCQGKVWLNLTWAGDAQWALDEAEEGVELDYAIPEEGSNAWVDGWVIPIYAKNVKAASYFINFMCRSENALRNMEYAGD
ncbi:MAG: ABC transporter substrate-binding protein, partial [Bacteroidales bacterium]|nr:ABC transporter substrate-binding protein [Bacteroidales bacterium]